MIKVFKIDMTDGVGRWKIARQVAGILVSFGPKKGEKDLKRKAHWGGPRGHEGFGANVASGDLDGDGKDRILVGAGPDPRSKAIVRIFRSDGTVVGEIQAYPDSMRYGVKISKGTLGE